MKEKHIEANIKDGIVCFDREEHNPKDIIIHDEKKWCLKCYKIKISANIDDSEKIKVIHLG